MIQSFFNSSNPIFSVSLPNLLLFLLGGLLTLSYSPFHIWFIPFITFPVLLIASLNSPDAKQAAKYGFVFGLGWFSFGLSWVHNAISDFGGLPLIFSLLLMLMLASYMAVYPALVSWLFHKSQSKFSVLIIAPIWLAVEYLRSVIFTGFPWLSIGYSQLTSSLSGYVPIVGEFGLQVIVMLVVCLILISLQLTSFKIKSEDPSSKQSKAISKPQTLALSAIVIIFISGHLLTYYQWNENNNKHVDLALVQGNITQSMKWQPENERPTMLKYYELSSPHFDSSDLIIWPEAAVPRIESSANRFLTDIDKRALDSNTALITGIVDYQKVTTYAFNNVIALGKKNTQDTIGDYQYLNSNRYSKHHLLPFGEFVPFESLLRKLAPIFDLPFSSFNRGDYQQDNLIANGFNIAPAICFEIAFPKQINANLTNDTDFILTLSNDAWFGDSHGPWQHLEIAQMRALEFAMPVVRVTNNGVTAVIDAQGNIASSIKQDVADVLTYKLALSESHSFYKRFGNLTTLVFIVLLCGFLIISRKKKIS
ncbi:apolipoprotein N-acyltransferase [uncultured Psychrosphaera sp.]|uniref:apolipoprotein N-acyltransferase n=1 Tax=uncultured Psychrosphaera sp. TaxID=1403522 RepID=UPI0026066ED1|nr:apolipoprotein N-acyltransferase [uncultured Psychrosphaera sp.]